MEVFLDRRKEVGFVCHGHKKEKHDACKGLGCPECGGKKIDQVAYLPLFMYTHGPLSALINIEQTPNINFLKMSSIRTDATEYITITSPSFNQKEGSFSNEQTKDELYDKIREVYDKHFNFDKAQITKVYEDKNNYLVSTNSKYCENMQRSHASKSYLVFRQWKSHSTEMLLSMRNTPWKEGWFL